MAWTCVQAADKPCTAKRIHKCTAFGTVNGTATARSYSCCLLEVFLNVRLWLGCQTICKPAAACFSAAACAHCLTCNSQDVTPVIDRQHTLPPLLQGRCSHRQLLLSATPSSPRWRWRPGPRPWWTWAAVMGSSSRCISNDMHASSMSVVVPLCQPIAAPSTTCIRCHDAPSADGCCKCQKAWLISCPR